MAQTSKSFRYLGSWWKPGTRLVGNRRMHVHGLHRSTRLPARETAFAPGSSHQHVIVRVIGVAPFQRKTLSELILSMVGHLSGFFLVPCGTVARTSNHPSTSLGLIFSHLRRTMEPRGAKSFTPISPSVPKPSRVSRAASFVFSNLPASQTAITRFAKPTCAVCAGRFSHLFSDLSCSQLQSHCLICRL
jgi:hypothetical protein